MAYILHIDGTREVRSEAEAEKLWLIKVGRAKPVTPAQIQYVRFIRKNIVKVRLNYRTAPDEYVRAYLPEIIEQVVSYWTVDRRGRPLRPGTPEDMAFAVKWGLYRRGKPTGLVTQKGKPQIALQLSLV